LYGLWSCTFCTVLGSISVLYGPKGIKCIVQFWYLLLLCVCVFPMVSFKLFLCILVSDYILPRPKFILLYFYSNIFILLSVSSHY
jgi:hypothetical protein